MSQIDYKKSYKITVTIKKYYHDYKRNTLIIKNHIISLQLLKKYRHNYKTIIVL